MKRILFIMVALLFAATSCENLENSKVPTDHFDVNLEISDPEGLIGSDAVVKMETLSSVHEGFESQFQQSKTRIDGNTVIIPGCLTGSVASSSDLNGYLWLGETRLQCEIYGKDESKPVVTLTLYIEGKEVKADNDSYCTPTMVKAEVSTSGYECVLTPNKWDSRTSTTAMLRVLKSK